MQRSSFAAFRITILSVAVFFGIWDVERLLVSGGQSPNAIDLITCPVVPFMRLVASYVNISDAALMWVLFLGNAATYGAAAYFLFRAACLKLNNSAAPRNEL